LKAIAAQNNRKEITMDTEKIVLYISLGIVCLCLITALIVKIVKLCKMPKEEREKVIKTYLKGIIMLAEEEIIGTKKGEERLAMVEEYFNKNAPLTYRIILFLLGKDNLKNLIEDALTEIKEALQ
jgi:hypothetical protein